MGKRRDRRHAVLGGGGRRMKLDLRNDDEVATAEDMNMSVGATVEEGGEKTGVESDERLSPDSLPGPVQVNPLSLLGQYSDEDEEEDKSLANGLSGGVPAVAVAGQVDEQVANFLADLETSGLLKDEVAPHEDETESEGAKQAKPPQEVDTKEKETSCEWEAVLHKESSEYYYWNKITGATTWDKPAAYASYEEGAILKGSNLQDELEKDRKRELEDSPSRSEPAHEALAQETVSTTNNGDLREAKSNIASEDLCEIDFVESDRLKDVGPEEMNLECAVEEDVSRDSDGGKQIDNFLETKESSEMIESPFGNSVKSKVEIRDDPEVPSSAAVVEHDAGESCQLEASVTLNTVENDEGAEDLAVESDISGAIEDHLNAVDRADATGLENSDPENVLEQPKIYNYHRILERGEVLTRKFTALAGEALRCLSLKVRLAVESDVRLSDCKAMATHDVVGDRFWERMDSQITKLEALLLVEETASLLESEQQAVTSSVADGDHQSRPEADVHEAQGTEHHPAAVVERSLRSSDRLRSENEDVDVDMDLDMEPEDENIVGTSATAAVDHDATSALPVPLLYESTLPQPLVYTPTQSLPQLGSYGPAESQPPLQPLNPLPGAPLFPVAPLFPSVAPVFPVVQSSFPVPPADSWVPPPPPEEEWAPPPLPDQEAPPPPPPDEDEPPLASAPDTNTVDPPYSAIMGSSGVYYSAGTNQSSLEITSSEKQDMDSSRFGVVDANPGSVHVNGNALLPAVASTGTAETITKKSNKGRNKKRSHSTAIGASLKSNKKVSSLVNKWLAAQEELHSSDEEEEDKDLFDVEALEKKRQKEIEEWRHQTLASGGALENANFQPLGTLDWRDRVKRARKEASKLAAKQEKDSKSEELKKDPAHASDESNLDKSKAVASTTPPKKPDLKELNKDLPPGWQAFWDAESCEVYYGNLSTSETSWDRPALSVP